MCNENLNTKIRISAQVRPRYTCIYPAGDESPTDSGNLYARRHSFVYQAHYINQHTCIRFGSSFVWVSDVFILDSLKFHSFVLDEFCSSFILFAPFPATVCLFPATDLPVCSKQRSEIAFQNYFHFRIHLSAAECCSL